MENLPTITPEVEAQEVAQVAQNFNAARTDLEEKYTMLRSMEPSLIKASMAEEFMQDAKRYKEAINSSKYKIQKDALYQAHRVWAKALKNAELPADNIIDYGKTVLSDWENQRRRENELDRREREKQINLFAAKQREAEIAHLREIGKEGQAEERAKAPVIPITVNSDPDAGKLENTSLVEVWIPKRDEDGNFVFRQGANDDEAAYRRFITENPAMWHLQSYEYGRTKRWLTDSRGMVQPPGLVIEQKFEPRTKT